MATFATLAAHETQNALNISNNLLDALDQFINRWFTSTSKTYNSHSLIRNIITDGYLSTDFINDILAIDRLAEAYPIRYDREKIRDILYEEFNVDRNLFYSSTPSSAAVWLQMLETQLIKQNANTDFINCLHITRKWFLPRVIIEIRKFTDNPLFVPGLGFPIENSAILYQMLKRESATKLIDRLLPNLPDVCRPFIAIVAQDNQAQFHVHLPKTIAVNLKNYVKNNNLFYNDETYSAPTSEASHNIVANLLNLSDDNNTGTTVDVIYTVLEALGNSTSLTKSFGHNAKTKPLVNQVCNINKVESSSKKYRFINGFNSRATNDSRVTKQIAKLKNLNHRLQVYNRSSLQLAFLDALNVSNNSEVINNATLTISIGDDDFFKPVTETINPDNTVVFSPKPYKIYRLEE